MTTSTLSGQDYHIIILPGHLDLSHFESFLNKSETNPLSEIEYFQNRIYSNNRNYYVSNSSTDKVLYLKDKNGEIIQKIEGASLDDNIIWLSGCVIIDRFLNEPNKKILINLITGKQVIYNTTDKFIYVGQSDTLCYFYSIGDYSNFDTLFLKSRQSVVSLNENGAAIEYNNPTVLSREWGKSNYSGSEEWIYSYSDSMITFDYYNRELSSGFQSFGSVDATRYFKNYDSIWPYPENVATIYMDRDVFYHNGFTFALLNNKAIYRFGDHEVIKILDCADLNIRNFLIENQFLIFTSKDEMKDKLVGIMNMNTRELKFPKVKIK